MVTCLMCVRMLCLLFSHENLNIDNPKEASNA